MKNTSRLGPTWDDWYYPESLSKQIKAGLFIFNGDYASFASGYGLGSITVLNYAAKFLTFDFNSEIDSSLDALFYRRVIQIILTVVSAYVFVSILRSLGFEKKIAWFAPLLLLTLPNWIGQGEINVKDLPVAAGLLLIVDCFFKIIDSKGIGKKSIYAILEGILGIHLSFGTRFGLFIFIFLSLVFILVLGKSLLKKEFKAVNKKILSTLLLGYLLLTPLNPILLNPFKVAYYSVFGTLSLFNLPAGPVLTANQLIDGNNPPYWYLSAWTLAQMPTTHLILLLGGILILIDSLRSAIVRRKILTKCGLIHLKLAIFTTLTFGPYLAAFILRPPLYDGDRQFLMAYPFFILLMVTFLRRIYTKVEINRFSILWIIVSVLLLFSPGYSLAKIAPFTYSFRNELLSDPRQWEGDYFGVSLRAAVSKYLSKEDKLAFDFSDERWLVIVNRDETSYKVKSANSGYVFIATRRGARQAIPIGCTALDGIKTKVFERENTLAFVAICPKEDMREEE